MSLGYNLTGFSDEDLDTDGIYNDGLRLGVHWKFDEEMFYRIGGWLFSKPAADSLKTGEE
ncbi:hypothetical protein EPICR_30299 [Candidatus Desulfarcum epimagneticum]|uniref:Uncharacterized protein n=1 Tax=uncultured Desulfobacteraceae bacterium TaxID=218296 RepID=A0A484HGK9_9BACT|nr:hypothetical protein EPICR_30299 [uncultured Desulfobacteraceae bacterium]